MIITSVNNKKIQELVKLKLKKYRDESKSFLIEGRKQIEEANKFNIIKEIIILEEYDLDIELPKTYVTSSVMKKLSSLKNAPKYIAVAQKKEQKQEFKNKILFLDEVQDPGNIGTILRSAYAFGIETIILKNCPDIYNEKIIRSSLGYLMGLNIIETNTLDELKNLEAKEYQIISTKLNEGISVKTLDIKEKFVIIVGNEGNGVTNEVSSLSTDFVFIDMVEECESLNVSVAASIIMYEVRER